MQNFFMENTVKSRREEEMFAIVEASEKCGITKKAYCKKQGLSAANFYYWQKKYRESHTPTEERFIPVQVKSNPVHIGEIEICYPNGVRVKLSQGMELPVIKSLIGLL